MPEIVTAPATRLDPLQAIREAIAWACRAGIRVELNAEFGVHLASRFGQPHWFRNDTGASVCPLGALILQHQPDGPEDCLAAVADILDVEPAFVAGLITGLDNAPPSELFQREGDRRLFMDGARVGIQLRIELGSRICGRCGRRASVGRACPRCQTVVH